MQKKLKTQAGGNLGMDLMPLVAASLAGTIYQAKLFNRQAKLNIPEDTIIGEVISVWQDVMKKAGRGTQ